MKNVLVAQSGGPTAAINATLSGVVKRAYLSKHVEKVYGGINGIKGIISNKLVDLTELLRTDSNMEILIQTPAAALGSCRHKLKAEEDFERIVQVFNSNNIGYFIYIGGNDSMDTVLQLSEYCRKKNVDVRIMGAPKTIDNDLCETDHTPGFGTAAKYVAITTAEIIRDISVYDIPAVTILEVMGRNAGWLTAASVLSSINGGDAPDLIYLPEAEFSIEKFIADTKAILSKKSAVLVVVSEGIKNSQGNYISESGKQLTSDAFGHKYLSGAAKVLESHVANKIGCKVRSIELNLMQRASSHISCMTDIEESIMLGSYALECALAGATGEMAAIKRLSTNNPYEIQYTSVPIEKVANNIKFVPAKMINIDNNFVTNYMIEYLKPLIKGERNIVFKNGLPLHLKVY